MSKIYTILFAILGYLGTHGQSQDAFAEAMHGLDHRISGDLVIGLAHRLHHPGGRVVLVSLGVVEVTEIVALELETRTKSFT